MKKCYKCKIVKPLSEYNTDNTKKDKLQGLCKKCNRDGLKVAQERNRLYVENIKSNSACVVCGENHYATIVFHHRNPANKKFGISLGKYGTRALKTIQAEIDKCDVMCANCHRILHWKERSN